MPRPRRRVAALVLGAALLFTVGTSVQAGWLLVLSSILLGAAIAGLLLPLRMVRGVSVERRAPEEAFQGELVAVELTVRNAGRGMRLGLEVEDPHLARTRMVVPPLGPGDRAVIGTTRRAARRGVQESTAASVRSAAPFGVAQARRPVDAPGRTVVYPAVVELRRVPLIDLAPTHDSAMHTAPRRGTGPEYLGIREYRTGDSMRHVHWPSTARHGQVMVREFEREHTRRLAIVVDMWADAGEEDTPLDAACSVAASVAFAALGRGHGVRLVAARDGSGREPHLPRRPPRRGAVAAGGRAAGRRAGVMGRDRLPHPFERGPGRVSETTLLIGVVTRRREPPEDSIRLRVVVAALVMVALVAVVAQAAPMPSPGSAGSCWSPPATRSRTSNGTR